MAKQTKRVLIKPEKLGMDAKGLQASIGKRLMYSMGKEQSSATERDWYNALALAIRDRLMARWNETQHRYEDADCKKVYYLSLEFLIGRSLTNAIINLDLREEAKKVFEDLGVDLEKVRDSEWDAALGNGGLGRLAACFIDSMATLGLPGFGYGIRYDYGMFYQEVNKEGEQIERPDNWLRFGNMWEFPRPEVTYPVHFNGRVVHYTDNDGNVRYRWTDHDTVQAEAYDMPVPGNNTKTVNHLRLWSAKATAEFNLQLFNVGDYIKAVEDKNTSENLSRVLYPDDTTERGRTLRLMQQYFFVTASLQDILAGHLKKHKDFSNLPEKVAIQLNDTHPTLAIPELMRILMDDHQIEWDEAWGIVTKVFSYTNHTLLPEALETWPVYMFEKILPRHLQIVYEINHRFLNDVMHRHPGDKDRLERMSIVAEDGQKRVRMGHLAVIGSHKVNGVAAIHSKLVKELIFNDFDEHFPGKFINVTNGITPRRWLKAANPELSNLITDKIGRDWENNLDELKKLEKFAKEKAFQKKFNDIKTNNKARLAALVKAKTNIDIDPNSMFDIQVKRIHEYKRQMLNVLHVITRYNRIRRNPEADWVPRTVLIGGKAAAGYVMAKRTIKLINSVADIVNNDPAVKDKLKLVFYPNYDVSSAQVIMPAANLSEQISTAGMEASGTGNMKLALNGALTIGTLDGANIEIGEEVGADNIFIFGMTAQEVLEERERGYRPRAIYDNNAELKEVLDMVGSGYFSPDWPDQFAPIVENLLSDDEHFLCLADYETYIACQEKVDELYKDQAKWTEKAILNTARVGKFSSDRSIQEYANNIWGIDPVL